VKPDASAEKVSAAIEGFFNEGIILSPEILHFADSCPGCLSHRLSEYKQTFNY
jgi:hypothetical protein